MREYYISLDVSELIAYDEMVTESEPYPEGDNWANPIKKFNEDKWAIEKHPDYSTDLELISEETLITTFYPEIPIP